ncbi:GNAT family N-acetyltransferase, partial [Peptoniphilus sp.]|uniref:GNAT family N-acetyltransferase n=1 Tax=Peptoniphilus sp. TaxID=1971214 RepID=UPI003D8F77AA
FVYEHEGKVIAAAIINKIQDESYVNAPWKYDAKDIEVCVIHTLVVDPKFNGKGIGVDFVKFYEEYAKEKGCSELRLDTNEKNLKARALYKNLGFEEIAIVPTTFNGIPDMNLVLLEKSLLG